MNFFSCGEGVRTQIVRVRTHVVATAVCATGSVHTRTCCTHIFLHRTHTHFLSVHNPHIHAWLKVMSKGVCCMRMLSLSISPSRFSCLTILCPCCSLTVTSRPFPTLTSTTFWPDFARLKKRGSSALPDERQGVWLPVHVTVARHGCYRARCWSFTAVSSSLQWGSVLAINEFYEDEICV